MTVTCEYETRGHGKTHPAKGIEAPIQTAPVDTLRLRLCCALRLRYPAQMQIHPRCRDGTLRLGVVLVLLEPCLGRWSELQVARA